MLLASYGPNCYSVTNARVGSLPPAWHSIFNQKTLTTGVPWSELLDNNGAVYYKELQVSHFLLYSVSYLFFYVITNADSDIL